MAICINLNILSFSHPIVELFPFRTLPVRPLAGTLDLALRLHPNTHRVFCRARRVEI